MKTDRELLELAARAAGMDGWWESAYLSFILRAGGPWRPLTDDGDALRLAVKLDLLQSPRFTHEIAVERFTKNADKLTATRRAIVLAAAAIGEGMAQSSGSTELPEDNYYKSQAEAEEAGGAAAIGEAIP